MNEKELLEEIARIKGENTQILALKEARRQHNARLSESPLSDAEKQEMMLRVSIINARADQADIKRRGRRWIQVATTISTKTEDLPREAE